MSQRRRSSTPGAVCRRVGGRSAGRPGGLRSWTACRSIADLPWALAAVDLALWDRAGRRAGRPVASLLTDEHLADVACNATIGATDRAGAAAQAAQAVAEGFSCVKLKVGIGDDAGRVAAVRAAIGPDVLLRLDANGAWSVDEAVATIDALASAGLELVEEPVHGLDELREVRGRLAVRVALDESAALPGALAEGIADAVCLKIARCGGISGLLAQAALARAMGTEVYVASSFDGPRGIAAGGPCGRGSAGRCPVRPGDPRPPRCRGAGRASGAGRIDHRALVPGTDGLDAAERLRDCCGCLAGQPVAGAGHDRQLRIGELGREALTDRGVLGVALTRKDECGHGELAEAVPERAHRACADSPQRGGEPSGAVTQQLLMPGREHLGRVAGEERLPAPALGEVLDWRRLDGIRQSRVGPLACLALARVLNPRRGRHEHKGADSLGHRQRDM